MEGPPGECYKRVADDKSAAKRRPTLVDVVVSARIEVPRAVTIVHLVVLAVIQGVTEFLPISSSAHLILMPALTGWPDQGTLIDVAAHVGTLFAVSLYFWRDILGILRGLGRFLGARRDPGARLFAHLIVATLPLMAVGGGLYALGLHHALRSPELIGWTMLGFGLVLLLADRIGVTIRRVEHLTLASAFLIGCAQALALLPGTSRAGICVTAARFLGFERADAARLAMLLSIPAIGAAGALGAFEIWRAGDLALGLDAIVTAVVAFLTALAAIAGLMRWLSRSTYTPFVVYRVILGVALLAWVYGLV